LDENVWGDASETDPTWLTANSNATAAFDAGSCATVVDADRLATGQTAICPLFDGSPNNPALTNSQGLNKFGGGWMLDKHERFARAFADAYQRANNNTIFLSIYETDFELRVPLEQAYMDNMIATGHP
jgi:hypothetical protein